MASRTVVLPWALPPVSKITRRGTSTSRRANTRKMVRETRVRYILAGKFPRQLRSDIIQRGFIRRGFPHLRGAVGEDDAVQVVNLVLENARQPAFGFDGDGLVAA